MRAPSQSFTFTSISLSPSPVQLSTSLTITECKSGANLSNRSCHRCLGLFWVYGRLRGAFNVHSNTKYAVIKRFVLFYRAGQKLFTLWQRV